MRRPITIVVAVLTVAIAAYLAIQRMKVDIFPKVGAPAVYVAQPYGGMDPSQMEGYMTYYYEYHFLYITGIEHVESKNIQGVALMKLVFHPETDMSQAMAEVVGYVNRARAFMPPGAVPPFIMRFDAGSVPVAQLVFSSPSKTPGEMQDIALNRVRPIFATLPGVSAPPPFGGNQRTIVIRVDPERLRDYKLSPEQVIGVVNRATTVVPSGNVRTGDLNRIATTNAALGANISELLDTPLRSGAGPTVYLRDVGTIQDSTDIIVAYAHVNGRRTVYIPVTKRADASTLDVIRAVKENLPRMRAVAGDDVGIELVFDQSRYVLNALRALVNEGLLGAGLAGLMVLLFLRDWRSALIVIATIPFALLGAVVGLWFSGQTINIMTLGGLALAVGVLVDEATVAIESIHSHRAQGLSPARAAFEASRKTAVPRLLAMLCVIAVFLPSFFMTGVGRQLFVPLSLAVGFAMMASYLLSSTMVPVLATWLSGGEVKVEKERDTSQGVYARYVSTIIGLRWMLVPVYLAVAALCLYLFFPRLGSELFPQVETGQLRVRMRAPTGTRIERTELIALKAIDLIEREVGKANVEITTAFIGVQAASYPINTIHLWTSGPHEAVMSLALKPESTVKTSEELREKLRKTFARELPQVTISFEAPDIISQVMSFGSPTPIEVAVQSPRLPSSRAYAEKVRRELAKLTSLRDLQYSQSLDYPSLNITVDRDRAGQMSMTTSDVAKSLVIATSSSRFTDPNYWRDPRSGNAFQIQVEIPQSKVASIADVQDVPISAPGALVGDVAKVEFGTTPGQVDRYNMQRVVSLTANLHGKPLSEAVKEVRAAIGRAGDHEKDVTVSIRGQVPAFDETLAGLRNGVLLAIGAIFLLLAANFQSFRLSLAVVSTIPAVICGVVFMLLLTGTTLNVQSFMGSIMAIGISVANAILLVTFAEESRRAGATPREAAAAGAQSRLRAILMTATAMIAGMIPMAIATGERGQTAPLGRAVIGGLFVATIATVTILPAVYAMLQPSGTSDVSLLPQEIDKL
jgi:multidrug efflux pump subunit AcrB